MHSWIRDLRYLEKILDVEECLVGILDLFDDSLHVLVFVLVRNLLYPGLNFDPNVAEVARQVRIESRKWKQGEQSLHVTVAKLVNRKRDRANTCPHQLLLRVVERHSCLEQGERLQTIVKEEIYGLVVQTENQCFEEVDKVVGEFIVLTKPELKRDQVGHERIAKQVKQVCLVFDVLDQD